MENCIRKHGLQLIYIRMNQIMSKTVAIGISNEFPYAQAAKYLNLPKRMIYKQINKSNVAIKCGDTEYRDIYFPLLLCAKQSLMNFNENQYAKTQIVMSA